MWYQGTSFPASVRTQGERDEFSTWREIGVFVLDLSWPWTDRTALQLTFGCSPVPTLLAKCPRSPAQHSCCCDRGGTDRHSTTLTQKNGWNSQLKCPCSFHHLETRVLAIYFFSFTPPKVVMWVKFHVQYVWAICNKNTEGKTPHHTSCYGALISWCPPGRKCRDHRKKAWRAQGTRGGSVINTCAKKTWKSKYSVEKTLTTSIKMESN